MPDRNTVVLVDKDGTVLGKSEKLAAHKAPGQLHLAFSVVLLRADGRLLLQQRAATKYHFPLLWANACCSHPGPGQDILASAKARVEEELGIQCDLNPVGAFVYRASCAQSGLIEHELDHVFVGMTDAEPEPNPSEVEAIRWVDHEELVKLAAAHATVPWLKETLQLVGESKISKYWPSS